MNAQPANPETTRLVEKWLASLSERDRQLQLLAAEFLKTSYFPEKTHGFKRAKTHS